eukprot:SAG31_NODE_25090_length_468_cov_0.785908_1_plen_155_part_11
MDTEDSGPGAESEPGAESSPTDQTSTIAMLGPSLIPAQLAPPENLDCYPIAVHAVDRSFTVSPAAALLEQTDAVIKMCSAPDGRPYLLDVQRSTDVNSIVRSSPYFVAATAELRAAADDGAVTQDERDSARARLAEMMSGVEALASGANAAALRM